VLQVQHRLQAARKNTPPAPCPRTTGARGGIVVSNCAVRTHRKRRSGINGPIKNISLTAFCNRRCRRPATKRLCRRDCHPWVLQGQRCRQAAEKNTPEQQMHACNAFHRNAVQPKKNTPQQPNLNKSKTNSSPNHSDPVEKRKTAVRSSSSPPVRTAAFLRGLTALQCSPSKKRTWVVSLLV
jgi:hypothetical protein